MLLFAIICTLFVLVLIKIIFKCTNGKCKSNKKLNGMVAIVTGGNSGIGFEVAKDLAKRGCKVIIADVINAQENVKKIIKTSNNPEVYYKYLNLASLQSVRDFVSDFKNNENRLDLLINNAGVAGFNNIFTSDNLLKVMQINHLGPFLLTYLLIDILKSTKNSRIVFTSSYCILFPFARHTVNAQNINVPSPHSNRFINTTVAYKNSKVCTLIVAKMFAKKYKIICNSVHPGVFKSKVSDSFEETLGTSKAFQLMSQNFLNLFGKTLEEAAQTTLHCALADLKVTGQFFLDCREFPILPGVLNNEVFCEEIFNESMRLVGIKKEDVLCANK